jgi:hypothetical protein
MFSATFSRTSKKKLQELLNNLMQATPENTTGRCDYSKIYPTAKGKNWVNHKN